MVKAIFIKGYKCSKCKIIYNDKIDADNCCKLSTLKIIIKYLEKMDKKRLKNILIIIERQNNEK